MVLSLSKSNLTFLRLKPYKAHLCSDTLGLRSKKALKNSLKTIHPSTCSPTASLDLAVQFIREKILSFLSHLFDLTLSHLTIQLFSDQIFLRAELTLCNLLFPVGFYSNTFGLNEEKIPYTFPCLFQIFIEHLLCSRYWGHSSQQ